MRALVLLIIAVLFAITPAAAQLQPDKVYDLKLTGSDIALAAEMIQQGPYVKVAPLLQKLLDQTKQEPPKTPEK